MIFTGGPAFNLFGQMLLEQQEDPHIRHRRIAVEAQFGEDEVRELLLLLDSALGDLSMEIADTDNASFRRELQERRLLLQHVSEKLGA